MCFVITPHGTHLEVPQSGFKASSPKPWVWLWVTVHSFSSLNFSFTMGWTIKFLPLPLILHSWITELLLLYYAYTSGSPEGPNYIQDSLELQTLSWATRTPILFLTSGGKSFSLLMFIICQRKMSTLAWYVVMSSVEGKIKGKRQKIPERFASTSPI